MKVYKGTDKNMRCKGLQYEVGKAVTVDGDVKLCERGLHACEMPLDVLNYYPQAASRYFEAELDGVTAEKRNDTKRVGNRLTLKAELSIASLVKAQIEYIKERGTPEDTEHATGYQGAASATGNQGAASATGYQGAASATGNQGAASATGYQGAASATGNQGAASATGYQGAASATGIRGAASATGDCGAASATSNCGAASATGIRGAASATGYQGAASATGDLGAASATGYQGAASATGDLGAASATGYQGAASATGYQGAASATGYQGAASATGNQGAASATGKACVALSTCINGKVLGEVGNAIVCVERGDWDGNTYPIKAILSAVVDGEIIKAGVWYTVEDGKWVEAQ